MASKSYLIERSDIGVVWRALGGGELRHGRGRAFWRGGDGYNVALNASTNCWRDFASGEGGGIVALIERSLGCSRQDAWRWLAAHHNLEFGRYSRAQSQRNRFHLERVRAAEAILKRFRQETSAFLRSVRNSICDDCRQLDAWATGKGCFDSDPLWEEFAQVPDRMRIADGIDVYISELDNMGAYELIELRNRRERRTACQPT